MKYIVCNQHGPTRLGGDGALWLGLMTKTAPVTLFDTPQAARAAIRRTLKYAKASGYTENPMWGGYFVLPADIIEGLG
jgi:hypothetical protein